MPVILQDSLPDEMGAPRSLPGVAPCAPQDWLRVDAAYGAQMAHRLALMAERPGDVLWREDGALEAAREVLDAALVLLPRLGFRIAPAGVACPDGRKVTIDRNAPLRTLGALVQEDICILQRRGEEHVLTGAVLCFPAGWRLADKVGRPLTAIHDPVGEYDAPVARRVQRLFDGVQVGRPLWRFNRLGYADAELHQPRKNASGDAYIRSERQCVVRMPESGAVVFSIHTYVIKAPVS